MTKMIVVEKIDGQLVVKFPYSTEHIEKIKTINWNVSTHRGLFFNWSLLSTHRGQLRVE